MIKGVKCCFCGASTDERPPSDSAPVRCNVREFQDQVFTVWRCAGCGSLHTLEPINYDHYYRNYPIQRQKYDAFTRATLSKRLQILTRAGLIGGKALLDYGCGSGHFVRYAREQGVQAEGYDPYSEEFGDPAVLDRGYDFVTAQDVLEHVDDPAAFIASMKRYVAPGGCVVIGTPNADAIDLHHRLDQVGPLHQPYHRHIAAASELQRLVADGSWQVVEFSKDWYVDTRVPFVNSAFLFRYFESGGGFMDVGFDPVSPLHMLKYPGLLFWGLFGYFFSRKTDMVVVARAPAVS